MLVSGCGDPSPTPPGGHGGASAPPARRVPGGVLHPEIAEVTDAVERGEGWLVLDARSARVHVLDARGEPVRAFGRRGDGPGELDRPAFLVVRGDTVAVVDLTGTRIDRFRIDGRFLHRISVPAPECAGGLVAGAAAAPGGPGMLLLRRCLDAESGRRRVRLVRVDAGGGTTPLAARAFGNVIAGSLDPFRLPVLAAGPAGLHVGLLPDPCLERLSGTGSPLATVCHPDPPAAPVPEAVRRRLEERFRGVDGGGVDLRIPAVLPPFDRVFSLPAGLLFRTVEGMEARGLELLRPDGALVPLGGAATPWSFADGEAVLVAEPLLDGTRIAIRRPPELSAP